MVVVKSKCFFIIKTGIYYSGSSPSKVFSKTFYEEVLENIRLKPWKETAHGKYAIESEKTVFQCIL